jgi:hypothetical protein
MILLIRGILLGILPQVVSDWMKENWILATEKPESRKKAGQDASDPNQISARRL